jgi:6-pyruvoyltetrahydropterin/6-carboxytetrahydropterin synthase
MIRLTRRYRFSASHRLHSPVLTAAQNAELYGKCNNPHGHGHDYVLDVSVSGPVKGGHGRLVSVPALDRLVEVQVLSRLRHRDLNTEAWELAGAIPTSENLAEGIRGRLLRSWQEAFPEGTPVLDRIVLRETRRNSFEIPGSL